ncbi:uncharacterized protein LOC132751984 [Ruditapes philippinarum]|uniref:uncharacterized protein LOC132751984 n=1 Tax=Ruditapes philippinarum TaxID=129788 RepID=UPI00295AF5D6|nr:uncharacterized protein LOC132751984 [Ruditapes philippinarum]
MIKLTMNYVLKVFCFLQLIKEFYGDIKLSCDTINTQVPANVTCICTFSGDGISWFYPNGTHLVNCLPSVGCVPMINGFVFSMNVSASIYKMTVINYSYSDCIYFTCNNIIDSSVKKSARPQAAEFDLTTQVSLNEPSSNYSSGNISITIGCVYKYWKLKTKWFIVNVDSDTEYSFDRHAPIFNADNSSCNPCDDDPLASFTIGFIHTETNESNSKKVSFKVKIYHEDYPSDFMMLNFGNEYTVRGKINGRCIMPFKSIFTECAAFFKSDKT